MKLFKVVYILNKEQKMEVQKNYDELLQRVDKYNTQKNGERSESNNRRDNNCPNCDNKNKKTIVNKIQRTQGKGLVVGNLFGMHGSSEIDTIKVRHCNDCGEEWNKIEQIYIWKTDSIKEVLSGLNYHVKVNWKSNIYEAELKVFQGCYLETILKFINKNNLWNNWRTVNITKAKLKKKFPSVFRISEFCENNKDKL